MTQKIF